MRKLFFAFLLVALTMPALACDVRPSKGLLFEPIQFTPFSYSLMGYRSACSSSTMCTSPFAAAMRRNLFGGSTFNGTYAGIPFHSAALFCRMENYTQRNYSVKFSVHAGGYHE